MVVHLFGLRVSLGNSCVSAEAEGILRAMRIYPEVMRRRIPAVLLDLLAVLLILCFAKLGLAVNDAVDDVAGLGRGVQAAGGSVQTGFDKAGEAVSGVPLVGGGISDAFSGVGDATGGNAVELGRDGEQAVEHLASLLGWTTFLVPTLLLLIAVVPRRVRQIRRLNAAGRILRAGTEEERRLLAMRAAFSLPYGTLIAHTSDPIGDLAAGDYDTLLAALYEDSGLEPPREKRT